MTRTPSYDATASTANHRPWRRVRAAVAGLVFLALGWGAGRARARVHVDGIAARPPQPTALSTATGVSRARRPLPKLRALDVVFDPEEVKNWAAADVARLGAKKWTDHLAETLARQRTVGKGAASGLGSYMGGWLAVVDETAPYSRQQFSESLRDELCETRSSERALLGELAPSLPPGMVPACGN